MKERSQNSWEIKKDLIKKQHFTVYKKCGFKRPKYKFTHLKDYPYEIGPKTNDYEIQNNNKIIDNLIRDLINKIRAKKGTILKIAVGGLTGYQVKKKAYIKNNEYLNFIERLENEQKINYSKNFYKPYIINFKLDNDSWGINEHLKKFKYEAPNWEEYYAKATEPLRIIFENELKDIINQYTLNNIFELSFMVTSKSSVWIRVYLKTTGKDFIYYNQSFLSELGKENLKPIGSEVDLFLKKKNVPLYFAYSDEHFRNCLIVEADNNFRKKNKIPLIGEGWANEANLRKILKQFFPKIEIEYSPKWINQKRLDIFLPSKKIAIEYHGEQHYKPNKFFGGKEAFKKRIKSDQEKKELCLKKGVSFVEWPYTIKVNRRNVKKLVNHINSKKKIYYLNVKEIFKLDTPKPEAG